MLKYRWKFRKVADEDAVNRLAQTLKIPKSLAFVLASRGVLTNLEAERFFEPKLEELHNPFLMDGMDKAVERILKAVRSSETIWIHGDYDVDGTASTSMLLQFLREIGGRVGYFIPDRFHDGYGLSETSINEALRHKVTLLITVDVGINSFEAVDYARKNGIEVVICDHHEPADLLPNANVILDPIKPGCNYPFKHLAACGVVFKLVQALASDLSIPERALSYLDYVVIASAADMVPLIGENRILSFFGLQILNSTPRPGLKGLMDCTNQKIGTITASSIVYALAPLINAAGRLGDASRAVEMMICSSELNAFRIAQELEQDNRRRRAFDEKTFEEAVPIADKLLENGLTKKSLVIHAPHWHAGVIGIVASRLVDRYHLPTVLLTTINGMAKGSARSIPNFDIHHVLKGCSYLLKEFGGHKHAAGLSLDEDKIFEFRQTFDDIASLTITTDMLIPEILIDAELELNELSPKFLSVLSKFAPFGYDNYKPMFISKNVISANGVRIVGNNHIKFRAFQSNFAIDAIGYNLAEKIQLCTNRKLFTIVYNLEETNFNGQASIQLRIKDIRADANVD